MMRKTLISILFLVQILSTTYANAQGYNIYSEPRDKQIFDNYISVMKGKESLEIDKIIVETAKFFLSVPYVAHTLEIEPEGLVINLRGMDCTTFVETVLALSRTVKEGEPTFEKFCDNLRFIRYREGKISGYHDRLHYTSDWMYENEKKGIIRRVIHTPEWEPLFLNLHIMSSNPGKYKQLSGDDSLKETVKNIEKDINTRDHFYLPHSKIQKNASLFKSGDIVGFTTKIDGLDVTHMGIIYKEGNNLTFIHASLTHKKVIVNREPLHTYLSNTKGTGIILSRAEN